MKDTVPRYRVVDFAELQSVPCICGDARRAFGDAPEFPGTLHVTEIKREAEAHYHKRITETYYFLECEAGSCMQLDEDTIPVKPGMCVFIPAGVRHRAIGRMKVLIFALPKFDPADEWLD